MVVGCCGAGKSTLSKEIHEITGIELIHLDKLYWKPCWVEMEKEEWESIVKSIVKKERWIIDGNYSGTIENVKSFGRLGRSPLVEFESMAFQLTTNKSTNFPDLEFIQTYSGI